MQATGVHHVSVNVEDVDRALDFYVGTLGLVRRDDRPELGVGGAWLDAGGEQIHLIAGEVPPGKGQHFALRVDDIEGAIAELRERGVKVSDAMPIGSGHQSFLNDPDGNMIELHQPASSS